MQQLEKVSVGRRKLHCGNTNVRQPEEGVDVIPGFIHLCSDPEPKQIAPEAKRRVKIPYHQTRVTNRRDHSASISRIDSASTSTPSSRALSDIVSGGPILIDSRPV